MMALLYALLPITAVALGLLAALSASFPLGSSSLSDRPLSCLPFTPISGSARTLFWVPAALGAAFALLFPLTVEGSQDVAFYGIVYAAIGYTAMVLRVSMAKRCRPPR